MKKVFLFVFLATSCLAQDKLNKIEVGLAGVSLASDAYSTRVFLQKGFVEKNPIAKPFVQSNTGTIAYFGGSYGLLLETNKLLRNHTKIRHVLNFSIIGMEGYVTYHNFKLRK